MTKPELIEKSNTLYDQLEKARRMNDYDCAQAICFELAQINRQLHLTELQEVAEKADKIM